MQIAPVFRSACIDTTLAPKSSKGKILSVLWEHVSCVNWSGTCRRNAHSLDEAYPHRAPTIQRTMVHRFLQLAAARRFHTRRRITWISLTPGWSGVPIHIHTNKQRAHLFTIKIIILLDINRWKISKNIIWKHQSMIVIVYYILIKKLKKTKSKL